MTVLNWTLILSHSSPVQQDNKTKIDHHTLTILAVIPPVLTKFIHLINVWLCSTKRNTSENTTLHARERPNTYPRHLASCIE